MSMLTPVSLSIHDRANTTNIRMYERNGRVVDVDKIWAYYQTLKPLTLPIRDPTGNFLQLWKHRSKIIGSVLNSQGVLKIISGSKIQIPMRLDSTCTLLERLERLGLRRWGLSFDPIKEELTLWPYLIAAG